MTYKPFVLSDKTVLVTGANAGIGYGVAEALAQAGARLVIGDRRADRNDAAAEEFRRHGVEVFPQQVDISREEQVDAAFAEAVARYVAIGAVFANAGRSGERGPFEQTTTAGYREIVEANPFGTMFTARSSSPHVRGLQGRGPARLDRRHRQFEHALGHAGQRELRHDQGRD